jgi:hypothetical protein
MRVGGATYIRALRRKSVRKRIGNGQVRPILGQRTSTEESKGSKEGWRSLNRRSYEVKSRSRFVG